MPILLSGSQLAGSERDPDGSRPISRTDVLSYLKVPLCISNALLVVIFLLKSEIEGYRGKNNSRKVYVTFENG